MSDPRWTVRSQLRRERWTVERQVEHGLAYRGPADFVLRHGSWWPPTVRPDLRRGLPARCYGNAINAAVLYGLRYVEGYAVSPVRPDDVIPHAWNADELGRAIDLTWNPVGAAYLGVEFASWRADDATWRGDACVLNDLHRGWPLFRERWRGEVDPPDSFRPSHALLLLEALAAGDREEAMRQRDLAEAECAEG